MRSARQKTEISFAGHRGRLFGLSAQSAKTAGQSEKRGIDGGEWVKGRKRQIALDSSGLLLSVRVHAVSGGDSREKLLLFKRLLFKFPYLPVRRIGGKHWLYAEKRRKVAVPERAHSGFKRESQRYVVERTLWLGAINGCQKILNIWCHMRKTGAARQVTHRFSQALFVIAP